MNPNQKLILLSLGIFVSYFYFGILQEKVTRGKYVYESIDINGKKEIHTEKFTCTLVLVFIQCLTNYLASIIALQVYEKSEDKTPKLYHASVALTYLLGMVTSNKALQWIPYPTQVVGKSAKPIPVLILSVVLGGRSYPLKKYLFVLLIVTGTVLFMFKDKSGSNQSESWFGLGELLLLTSLSMDGLTASVQERIRAKSAPTGHQMMRATNFWAIIFVSIAIILSGEGIAFFEFAKRHNYVIYNLFVLGVTQSIGQLFLYVMVSDFGPLMVSIVTTTRKCFTVLASVLLFGNTINGRQWLGATIVFSGLFLDMFFSKGGHKKSINVK